MNNRSVAFEELDLTLTDVFNAMGYRGAKPDEALEQTASQLLEELAQVVHPTYAFQIMEGSALHDTVRVGDVEFQTGRAIAKVLRGADRFVVFLVTAGSAFESWAAQVKERGDIMSEFVADAIGSAMVGSIAHCMVRELKKNLTDEQYTNAFNPGQCDWDITQQRQLFALLGENNCGVTLSSSSLMHPIKSVTGIIGIGKEVMQAVNSCSLCSRTDCFRRDTGSHI